MDTIESYRASEFFRDVDVAVIQKLETLRNEFQLNHSSLDLKWEAFILSQKTGKQNNATSKPDLKTLDKFKAYMNKDQQQVSQRPKTSGKPVLNKTTLKDITGMYEDSSKSGRNKEDVESTMDIDSMDIEVTSSNKPSEILVTFNSQLEQVKSSDNNNVIVNIEDKYCLSRSYRYMNNKLSKRAEAIDKHVDTLLGDIHEYYKLESAGRINTVCSSSFIASGRIVSETDTKLNNPFPPSLECSRDYGEKSRVRIQLECDQYSIFPGQVVAMDATNPTSRLLISNKLYEPVALPLNKSSGNEEAVSYVVASGPYSDSLSYTTKLRQLFNHLYTLSPSLVILTGPFLDCEDELLNNGNLDVTYEEKFEEIIGYISELSVKLPKNTKVLIVPSLRDLSHDSIYPQFPFTISNNLLNSDDNKLIFCSNPCHINVNGIYISISSVDILKHLASEEVSKNCLGDRLSRLCSHILNQRSIYPLYPPEINVNIDYGYSQYLDLPYTPDILILPSDLQHFVKNVNNVLCINSGKMSKNTYAHGTVLPKNDSVNSKVVDRSRCDILKL